MKKTKFYLLFISLLLVYSGYGQLSGTKNIPGDYATLAAAITDLNTQGVGAGGVTLNLLAANNQTAPLGGYSITATGTVANPITITGNGNTITAPTPQTTGSLNDAIFKIIGGDYITIQGFTMRENGGNATTTLASNNMTEWGVAVLYASATDGAKNVTIQNNDIALNRTYPNTFGIYSSNRHTATVVGTVADITAASGANDNLKIYSNTISNVNRGICAVGSFTGAFMATGLDIGGGSGATANTLTNFGTTSTTSTYASVTTANVWGIYVNNNLNINVSYNSITSSVGGTTVGTLTGIFVEATGTLPTTGSITNTINNNSISVKGGLANGAIRGITNTLGNLITTYTINNNDFNNSGHFNTGNTPLAGASGAIIFINSTSAAINASINSNTFSALSVNTTGSVTLINKAVTHPANAIINVNNNSIVTSFNKTGAGGTVKAYASTNSSPITVTQTNNNNNFSNIIVTGATILQVYQNTDGSSKTITNNSFTAITGGTSAITPVTVINGNSIISNNTVSTVSGAGTITGFFLSSTNTQGQSVFNNTVNGLTTTGGATVTGFDLGGAGPQNVYKNKIYDLTANNAGTLGVVNGIVISGLGTNTNIYNNLIGDLKAPQTSNVDAVRGISINASTENTSLNITYNTIYINASSTGTDFGSSGIFQTFNTSSNTVSLSLKNNIIVNTSIPNGTGFTVAFRRSAATNLNNFATSSNNNLYYAGTPGINRLIFYDGTNSDQTLAAYKSRVTPRDANSITESPTFLSTTGSSSNFLHIDATVATQIESGGIPVSGITDDYDGDTRNTTKPDIGADEFAGIANDLTGPNISYTSLTNTTATTNRTIVATITDPSGVASGGSAPLIYYRKGTSGAYFSAVATSVSGNDYTFTIDYSNVTGGSVAAGDIIQYYIAAQDNLGNVTTVPYGGSGTTPPGSTAPATPGQYKISVTYVWQSGATDFQVAASWSPARTTPDISDILVFDGSVAATPVANNIPNQTITKLVFQNNVNATLNAAVDGNTLTFSSASGQTALDIQSGSTANIGTTTGLNLVYDLGIDVQIGTIAGILNINTTSTFTTTNSITTITGTLGINGTAFTPLNSTSSNVVFAAGSTLLYTKNGGSIPFGSYNASSTININGVFTSPITVAVSTGNLIYNSTGSASPSLSSLLTINGSLTIQNTGTGSFGVDNFGILAIAGDATINNGTWNISDATINITGSLVQNGGTIIKTSTDPQSWSAASVNQTAGTINMSNVGGLFTLTATSGNMSLAGTVNGGTSSGMILAFTGTANQNLSTSTVSNKVGITVNKSSGNVVLQNNLTINSGASVTLTTGKLAIANGSTLTIASGASVTGAASGKYIITETSGSSLGKLQYTGMTTSAQVFPIGTAINYMPVTVTPDNTGASFAAGVFEGATQNGAPNGSPVPSPAINEIVNAGWQIDRLATTTSATITLSWQASQEGSVFSTYNTNEIGIMRYNGTGWDVAIGTGDNTANTATANFSNFSPFIVGRAGTVLPLKLTALKAYQQGTGVKLEWSTLSEGNMDKFVVERSTDGNHFTAMGTVAATGNSDIRRDYSWLDMTPASGMNYYRIRAVELDGKISYTSIASVNIDNKAPQVSVYPNPVIGSVMNVQLSNMEAGKYRISLYNAAGQVVLSTTLQHQGGGQQLALPVKVQNGVYHLEIMNDKQYRRIVQVSINH